MPSDPATYFPYDLQLSASARQALDFEQLWQPFSIRRYPPPIFYRRLAAAIQASPKGAGTPVSAAQLSLYATLLSVYRYLIDNLTPESGLPVLDDALLRAGMDPFQGAPVAACQGFEALFPPVGATGELTDQQYRHCLLRELLLLRLAADNRAIDPFRWLLDDEELASNSPYRSVVAGMEQALAGGPLLEGLGLTLVEALHAPLKASPDSLAGQLGYIRDVWAGLIPPELVEDVMTAFDILEEEVRIWSGGGPGPSQVLHFGAAAVSGGGGDVEALGVAMPLEAGHLAGYEQPEYEAFSPDADWMSNVVLIAKMTHVWLDQLSRSYGYPVNRLDQIPDAELDQMASRGFTGLWLIGLWERSAASRRIKELCGNPEAHASAYSLYDYTIADDLGGEAAFHNLKQRAWKRGIRLASDMVPNHTGIYSRWVVEHPDWFVQTDYPPFPTYQFNGEDLSHHPEVTIQVEDGYWTKHDAAVTFRMIDRRDGRTRYIYHGNDGTSIPWNDTAQLNYLIPEVREAVMQTILHVARLTPIIRFDAAMTLAKKHYQRLWFPQRGLGGGIPSRAEHAMSREEFDAVFPAEFWREVVDRVAQETPGTLLLAEAFWMMEGYFVRTLGMHRVYNSAFMNMLKQEENAKYRQTIKNVLEFNPEILKRFVNFMNNPDEKTAVEQFGSQGKYFGACVLMSTMPGLPMFGHGQVEGYREKYGMEYRRAYWDEQVDQGLLQAHQYWIFPLLKRRWLFSGSEQFALFDFADQAGAVDENVFAYSNRAGSERALVLYNNCHCQTKGWVRNAAPVAVKQADGNTVLQQSTLGGALDLPVDGDSYVAFRDLVSGLVYLRNCAELHQQGLYAELGEYDFHIFWQFEIMQDDLEQRWGTFNRHLAGSGVHDLEEAWIKLANQALIQAFTRVLDGVATPAVTDQSANSDLDTLLSDYQQMLTTDAADRFDLAAWHAVLDAVRDAGSIRRALKTLRRNGVSRAQLSSGMLERRAALAVMLLPLLGLPLEEDPLKQCGLKHPVLAMIAGSQDYERGWGEYQADRCAAVALAWQIWIDPALQSDSERLATILSRPLLGRFLLVHEDNGVAWFNKERYEELLCWLTLVSSLESVTDSLKPRISTRNLLLLAKGAGYRVRTLLHLADDMELSVCGGVDA